MPSVLSYTNAFPGIPSPQHDSPATPGWTPNSLSNLIAFYRADIGVTQSSGDVSSWADQSGHGYTLTPGGTGNDPTWSSTGFNSSFPGISVAATSQKYLQNTGVSFSTTTFSCFILLSATLTGAGSRYLSMSANGVGNDTTTPSFNIDDQGSDWILFSSGALGGIASVPATPTLLGYILNGSNAQAYLNGVKSGASSSFSASLGSNPNTFSLFGSTTDTAAAPLTAAYVILTSGVMSVSDIDNLLSWTNTNWGTQFFGGAVIAPQNYLYPGALQPKQTGPAVLSWTNAFPLAAPQHFSGQTVVESFFYPGAVQPLQPPSGPGAIPLIFDLGGTIYRLRRTPDWY